MKGVYKAESKNKEVRSTVSLAYDIYNKLRDMAFKNDMTISNVMELLINGRPNSSAGYLFFIDKEVLLKIIAEAECKDVDLIELYINNVLRKKYGIVERKEMRERKRSIRKREPRKKTEKKVATKKKK